MQSSTLGAESEAVPCLTNGDLPDLTTSQAQTNLLDQVRKAANELAIEVGVHQIMSAAETARKARAARRAANRFRAIGKTTYLAPGQRLKLTKAHVRAFAEYRVYEPLWGCFFRSLYLGDYRHPAVLWFEPTPDEEALLAIFDQLTYKQRRSLADDLVPDMLLTFMDEWELAPRAARGVNGKAIDIAPRVRDPRGRYPAEAPADLPPEDSSKPAPRAPMHTRPKKMKDAP